MERGKRGKRVGEINNPLLATMAAKAACPQTQRKTTPLNYTKKTAPRRVLFLTI